LSSRPILSTVVLGAGRHIKSGGCVIGQCGSIMGGTQAVRGTRNRIAGFFLRPVGRSLAVGALFLLAADVANSEPAPVDFNRDIRPLLSNNCFHCHGPDAEDREANLRLDLENQAKADRGGYAAIVPGDADASELVRRITSEDEFERMPPPDSGKQLTSEQIELLRRWVAEGADWSAHWAYVPPLKTTPPELADRDWPLNWIDRFILSGIEAVSLTPSPEADRTTLMRRLSIDLTGLPPEPEAVERFVADDRPDAYERLVDRLLASPHYGEHAAAYWLDLVRYADTVGYHGDQDHNISPYRDYVIHALNGNLPFDVFTREQLAGDLLPEPTVWQRVATGYNRVLQTSHEGGVQPKEYLAIYAADRVRNVSAVWMGATLGCAQCHDHKYDPYTTKDFYSMAAFFADVDESRHFKEATNSLPTVRPPEIDVLTAEQQAKLDAQESRLEELRQQLAAIDVQDKSSRAELLEEEIDSAEEQLAALRAEGRRTMVTEAIEPRTMRILPRGNWLDDSGQIVRPAVPEFLGKLDVGEKRATRLDLANWLTDPDQGVGGLTARVFVNRLWYRFFGAGLASVMDDFGGQGKPPEHGELLDNLALEFVESGWDTKHIVRLLVTSRAYRQSSRVSVKLAQLDPANRLFARQARYRYPAEAVRDTALSVSGLLVDQLGGDSVRPYQPAGYYRHLNFPKRKYKHHADRRQWRRGVYVHWQRQFLHPTFRALDAPSREECTVERPRSNTSLAALALLNDPVFVEAARALATRVLFEAEPSDVARFDHLYRLAISRTPDDAERELLSALLEQAKEYYETSPAAVEQLLSIGQLPPSSDLDPKELSAWTTVARAMLNIGETTTRN